MAELADAADLKSAELTLIRVQVPASLLRRRRKRTNQGDKMTCRISDTVNRIKTLLPYITPRSLAAEMQMEGLNQFLAEFCEFLDEQEILQIQALMDLISEPPPKKPTNKKSPKRPGKKPVKIKERQK